MGFSEAIDNAMGVWFGDDLSDLVVLNSVSVNAQVIEQGRDEDADGVVDFIEAEFDLADYPAVDYRNDTLEYNGTTWRYPRKVSVDGTRTRIVRFVDNQRPRHAGGRRR